MYREKNGRFILIHNIKKKYDIAQPGPGRVVEYNSGRRRIRKTGFLEAIEPVPRSTLHRETSACCPAERNARGRYSRRASRRTLRVCRSFPVSGKSDLKTRPRRHSTCVPEPAAQSRLIFERGERVQEERDRYVCNTKWRVSTTFHSRTDHIPYCQRRI